MFKYLFIFFFTSSIAYGQFNYYLGYQDGYKYGCQCLNIPTKNVAYVTGSYDQGYVDGKLDGIIFIRNTQNTGNTTTYTIKPHNYDQPVYSPDFDFIQKALSAHQKMYSSNKEKVDSYVNSIKFAIQGIRDKRSIYAVNNKLATLFLLENAFYKDINLVYSSNLDFSNINSYNYAISIFDVHSAALNNLTQEILKDFENTQYRISQLNTLYNSFDKKDFLVKDGWHIVYSTNQKDFCEFRRVYVENKKIVKYVKEGVPYKIWEQNDIEFCAPILNCKSTIKLKSAPFFHDVYFIDVISDPNSTSQPPSPTGKVCFYTDYQFEEIEVYVEFQHVGTLKSHFSSIAPNCEQTGTIIFTNTAGTYTYVAVSDKKRWSGTFTLNANQCGLIKISK